MEQIKRYKELRICKYGQPHFLDNTVGWAVQANRDGTINLTKNLDCLFSKSENQHKLALAGFILNPF